MMSSSGSIKKFERNIFTESIYNEEKEKSK